MSFYTSDDNWPYVRVKGMGLVDALGVTHYHAEGREEDFKRMLAKHPESGVAIDNNCAIEFVDGGYRLITSQPGASAYKLHKYRGEVITERIEQREEFSPVADLLKSG